MILTIMMIIIIITIYNYYYVDNLWLVFKDVIIIISMRYYLLGWIIMTISDKF